MTPIGRILKDYRETGSLASALALWGFVDEHTFLTKGGAVGVVYRVAGADVECLDHPERQVIARRFEQALRQLDEACRLYEYVIKRPAAPIIAAVIISLAGCTGGPARAALDAATGSGQEITVAAIPASDLAGLYVALDDGLFARLGSASEPPPRRMRRQADQTTEAMVLRFLRDYTARMA